MTVPYVPQDRRADLLEFAVLDNYAPLGQPVRELTVGNHVLKMQIRMSIELHEVELRIDCEGLMPPQIDGGLGLAN